MDVSAMDSGQRLNVAEWRNSPGSPDPKKPTSRRFIPPTYVGILGTLLLHGFVFHSLPIGKSSTANRPDVQMPAAARSKSKGDESFVLLTLPITISSDQLTATNSVSARTDLRKMKLMAAADIELPSLPNLALPLGEDRTPKAGEESGDIAEQAHLFGIYTGQIRARVERIWRRPRSPVNAPNVEGLSVASDSFQCQVQIVQDMHGNVQEVLLPNCNGSPAWQRSLALAIQQASPLPAPPRKSVFSRSIVLDFVGVPFLPGSSDDEYELLPRNLVSASQ
jgi:TonB C terminal